LSFIDGTVIGFFAQWWGIFIVFYIKVL